MLPGDVGQRVGRACVVATEGEDGGVEAASERDGAWRCVLGVESSAFGVAEVDGGQDTPIGGLGGVAACADAGAVALLGDQLEGGLPMVGPEAERLVDGLECGEGLAGLVAVVAEEPADDRPVLLLDMSLVVLPIRAAPGEGQLLPPAPAQQVVIQELAAVVGVDAEQREGQPIPELLQGVDDGSLTLPPDRLALGPAGRHVGRDQGAQVVPRRGRAAVEPPGRSPGSRSAPPPRGCTCGPGSGASRACPAWSSPGRAVGADDEMVPAVDPPSPGSSPPAPPDPPR